MNAAQMNEQVCFLGAIRKVTCKSKVTFYHQVSQQKLCRSKENGRIYLKC